MTEIVEINGETIVTITESGLDVIEVTSGVDVIEVALQGPMGPAGPAGAGGGVEIPFAFGDASPKPLFTAPANKLIYSVEINIAVAFDGVGAQLVVGDAGNTSRLMQADQNDPTAIEHYAASSLISYGVDTPLILTITPGAGATAGSGVVLVFIQT